MRCEVVFRNPGSTADVHVPFDVADGATDEQIEAAAREALQARSLSNGIVDRTIDYDVFVDRNNDGDFRDSDDHRLYRRVTTTGGSTTSTLVHSRADQGRTGAGASPLNYRVAWARDQILRARMRDVSSIDTDPTQTGVQSMASLDSLNYTTDGVAGLSREEALSFVRDFEARFGSDDAGRARMRHVLDQNPIFEFGPDGNFRLNDVYTRAGVTPPGATARAETGAVDPNDPNNPTNPNSAAYNALSTYLNDPTPENLAHLRRQRGATDSLINELLAKLAMGNTDVLTACMDLVASQGQSTLAQNARNTILALQAMNRQIDTLNNRLTALREAQSYTGTDPARVSARNAANSEFQTVSLQIQNFSSNRSLLVGTLDTTMKGLEEERRNADKVREGMGAVMRASR